MILISAAAVGVSILLLIVAMITSNLLFVYVSIGVSVVAALLLALGVLREYLRTRDASAEAGDRATPAGRDLVSAGVGDPENVDTSMVGTSFEKSASVGKALGPAQPNRPEGGSDHAGGKRTAEGAGAKRNAAAFPPDDDVVLVVPGRRRFHRPGCGLLIGRLTEELTLNEAREEGFSACTTCEPASAARSLRAEQEVETLRGRDPAAAFPAVPARAPMPPARTAPSSEPSAAARPEARPPEAPPTKSAAPNRERLSMDPVARSVPESRTAKNAEEPIEAKERQETEVAKEAQGVSDITEAFGVIAPNEHEGKDLAGRVGDGPGGGRVGDGPGGRAWAEPHADVASGWGRDARIEAEASPPDETDASPPDEVSAGPGADPGDGPRDTASGGVSGPSAVARDTTVHVVRGVTRYHTEDCILIHVVDDEDVDTMTLADAEQAGCTPCRACHLE